MAVGDDSGTLHILEIPWSLRIATPNEVRTVGGGGVGRAGYDWKGCEDREWSLM